MKNKDMLLRCLFRADGIHALFGCGAALQQPE